MNDPNTIPDDIVQLAKSFGMIKQYLNLYIHGDLTWNETVVKIISSLIKDNRELQKLLSKNLSETPQVILGLPPSEQVKHAKLMPRNPL